MKHLWIFLSLLLAAGVCLGDTALVSAYKTVELKVVKTTGLNTKEEDPGVLKVLHSSSPFVPSGADLKVIDTNQVDPKLVPGTKFKAKIRRAEVKHSSGMITYWLEIKPTRMSDFPYQKFKSDVILEGEFPITKSKK